MYNRVLKTVEYIRSTAKLQPEIAIILGSGAGDLVNLVKDQQCIKYEDIPNFPVSTVEGHAGQLVFGKLNKKNVMILQGRFHTYEGYSMKEVAYPVYVMKLLGIKKMIINNAAGGANKDFQPGDLMIIDDFINLLGDNPLIGKNDDRFGPRFPDMTEPYHQGLIKIAESAANDLGVQYCKGVYLAGTGPMYETRAEVQMMMKLGADAIGMSTVPETIVANYLGIKVLGISIITNMCTGIQDGKHSHENVVKTAKIAGDRFCKWVNEIVGKI